MYDKPSAEGRMIDRGLFAGRRKRFGLLYEMFRRALGHSIIALVIACGFIKIAYVEAAAMIRETRGFFRAGPGLWRRADSGGVKFLLGKSVSPR